MKNYFSNHMVVYERQSSIGFLCLPILQFLVGQPWDQFALNFMASIGPISIRVVTNSQEVKIDARIGGVTVYLNANEMISKIEQEVSVGLEGGYEHGQALWLEARKRGIL